MKTILLDTNMLVVLAVGSIDKKQLGLMSRTKEYDAGCYNVLCNIIRPYTRHLSIPHVLSETSNLLGAGRNEKLPGVKAWLGGYISRLSEIYQPSRQIVSQSAYAQFGLTDAAIAQVSLRGDLGRDGVSILTDDGRLYGYLARIGAQAINFSHWRTPL